MGCIPSLVRKAEKDSALHAACHAVAYAYLANKFPMSSAALSHQARYGKALQALGDAMRDPVLQKQDETLLAVWLLGLSEVSGV